MKNGQVDGRSCLSARLGLHAVQIQMTQGAGRHHDIRPMRLGVMSMSGYHGQGVFFVNGEDGKSTAAGFSRKIDHLRAQQFNDPFQ